MMEAEKESISQTDRHKNAMVGTEVLHVKNGEASDDSMGFVETITHVRSSTAGVVGE